MNRMFAILVLTAAIAFAGSPFLTPGFNGFTPDQFPVPQIDPPVQPAGYAFAIWGLIYIWLILSTGFGLLRRADALDWAPHRVPLFISLAVGTSWLAVAQVSPVLATVQIWIMLITALYALFRTAILDRWMLQAPVAIYAGWLTAASFVAIGLLGAGHGVLMGSVGWAYVALSAALVFASAVQTRLNRAPEYGLTVIWALVGVIIANLGGQTGIVILAAVGIAVIGTFAVKAARN